MVVCRACSVIFNFSNDNNQHLEQKQLKRTMLKQLIELYSSKKEAFVRVVVPHPVTDQRTGIELVFDMIKVNILRTPKVQITSDGSAMAVESIDPASAPEEEEVMLEESWSHIQLVYELLVRTLVSQHVTERQLKEQVSEQLIRQLFELIKCPDPRERDYLKTIFHRIYSRLLHHRRFIRKQIQNAIQEAIYEAHSYQDSKALSYGIPELLMLLESIIQGFQTPVKPEHKLLFQNCLVPLLKSPFLEQFHFYLQKTVLQFFSKSKGEVQLYLDSLVKFWPLTSTNKEKIFLVIIGDLFSQLDDETRSTL